MSTHRQRKRQYPRQSTGELAAIAQGKDLEEQLDIALEAMHDKDDLIAGMYHKDKRIADLQQRLERAIGANVTLRQENAQLRALSTRGAE